MTALSSSTTSCPIYQMVTAELLDDKVIFPENSFKEAMRVGFFRIKAPNDLNLEIGREFAKTFTSDPRYAKVGVIDAINGYLQSEINQTVRFTLERGKWNLKHEDGSSYYSQELQQMGSKMNDIGIKILKSIFTQYELPENLWFKASGGSAYNEGSHFLLFNCYDPKLSDKPFGVGAHKDWGNITVLDATEPGLQAKIDGIWHELDVEDGYLTINFGYPLEKLLPGVHASEHRVVTQTKNMRTSTVVFIDPRLGAFSQGAITDQDQGYVYDWDTRAKQLINEESAISFFTTLSNQLFGYDQSGKKTNS